MPQNQIPILSPSKGVVRAVQREGQPPDTLWDALNIVPYDRYGRKRIAQRGGLVNQSGGALAESFIQGMIEAPNIVYPPGQAIFFELPVAIIPGLPSFNVPTPITPAQPSFSLTQQWQWAFSVTMAWAFSVVDPTVGGTGIIAGDGIFSWQLGPTPLQSLILDMQPETSVEFFPSGGGGGVTSAAGITLFLYFGNPADSPSTWVLQTSVGGSQIGATASGSISVPIGMTIVQNNGGPALIDVFFASNAPAGFNPGSHEFSSSFTMDTYPELTVQSAGQSVVNRGTAGSGNITMSDD